MGAPVPGRAVSSTGRRGRGYAPRPPTPSLLTRPSPQQAGPRVPRSDPAPATRFWVGSSRAPPRPQPSMTSLPAVASATNRGTEGAPGATGRARRRYRAPGEPCRASAPCSTSSAPRFRTRGLRDRWRDRSVDWNGSGPRRRWPGPSRPGLLRRSSRAMSGVPPVAWNPPARGRGAGVEPRRLRLAPPQRHAASAAPPRRDESSQAAGAGLRTKEWPRARRAARDTTQARSARYSGRAPGRGRPVSGSRKSFPASGRSKSNRPRSEPATSSNERSPIRPSSQLSSTKRRIDDWSVSVWSTKFGLANGEITRSGSLGP